MKRSSNSEKQCILRKFFKFKQFPPDVILQNVRWYLRYNLRYRNLGEMFGERGIAVDHSNIHRWSQRYAPELDKRCRKHLKMTNDSWRLDKTIIKIKGKRRYLWRTVDSEGNTLDFRLTARRSSKAAKRFFRKVLQQYPVQEPRVVSTDKYAVYPKVIRELRASGKRQESSKHRQVRYLNNIVEQDH
ncbi:MAG: IS6 family transposase, partial [Cyanobacteria bacterium P01_H01_bin.15]